MKMLYLISWKPQGKLKIYQTSIAKWQRNYYYEKQKICQTKDTSLSNVSVLFNATSVIDHSFIRSLTRDCQGKKRKWKSENVRENVKEMAGKGW